MKTVKYSSLGLEVPLLVPESVDEFDKNAKKVGACLDEGTNNVVYRGCLAWFRDLFIHGQDEVKDEAGAVTQVAFKGAEDTYGIKRKTKKVKDGEKEVEVFDETEGEYAKRLVAELVKNGKAKTEDEAKAILQGLANEAAKLVPFDASATERKAGPKKLAQTWIDSALNFLLGKKNAAGKTYNLDKAVAAVKKELGKEFKKTGNEAEDSKTLGWLLKDLDAAIAAKARAAREDALAG